MITPRSGPASADGSGVSVHRPLSEWVAEVELRADGGEWDPWAPPNGGDHYVDARHAPRFAGGWRRRRIRVRVGGEEVGALGLVRADNGEAVIELGPSAVPLNVSEAGVRAIEKIESAWPVLALDGEELVTLAKETPALRRALIGRAAEETVAPPRLFHLLPWDLVDRLARHLAEAVRSGGAPSEVRLAHWFTPAGSRFAAAMDRMNQRLRDPAPALAEHGGVALCERLAEAERARIPEPTRAELAALIRAMTPLLVTTEQRESGRRALERLLPAASVDPERVASWLEDMAPFEPGEVAGEAGGARVHVEVTEDDEGGRLSIRVDPPPPDLTLLVGSAVQREDTVVYLGRLADGRMETGVFDEPPYTVRPASIRRDLSYDAVEVFSLRPAEEAVAGDQERERREQLIVVPWLDLQVSAYESRSGQLIVSAAAGNRDAAGRWVELVVNDLSDGSVHEYVIPLHWAFDAAEGALSIGLWRDELTVALRTSLLDDPGELDATSLRRSIQRAVDDRTRDDLRALLAAVEEDGSR